LVELVHAELELRLKAGETARVEEYLARFPELRQQSVAVVELAAAEQRFRLRQGSPAPVEEYLRRFPALASLLGECLAGAAPSGREAETPADAVAATVIDGATPGASGVPRAGDQANRAGRYLLEGEIACGGMGGVLRARDPELNRPLAVKVLLERHRGDPELERRFQEEAQITGQLQHPGIPPVHEVGTLADGRPFFAMKLIEGRTLAELLHERSGPGEDLPRFLDIFEAVCQTLGYAHSRGVIHRDLKPANIMVGSFGEVQVMDWGLAKVLRAPGCGEGELGRRAGSPVATVRSEAPELASQAGDVLGTPSYMAPEQARGEVERLDERCDVFGLGAVLCELLTGQPPYTGPNVQVVHDQASRAELGPAWTRLDECGAEAELVGLAKRCLAGERSARLPDAGEVAAAVGAYLSGVQQRLRTAELERAAAEVRAEEAQAKAAAERLARRRLLGLAAAVLLLVLVGGGGTWWWWQDRRETVRQVEDALTEGRGYQQAGRWPEVRAALERARGRLGGGGPVWLHARVEQAVRDADLVADLEEVQLRKADFQGGRSNEFRATEEYGNVFRRYDLDVAGLSQEDLVARIRGSAVREALLAALDDWSSLERRKGDEKKSAYLREVANDADEDDWRKQLRAALARRDVEELKRRTAEAVAQRQPAAVLFLLYDYLAAGGAIREAEAVLRRGVMDHPSDFWLNKKLGDGLQSGRPGEAEGYYRVALSLRPGSPGVWLSLGNTLHATGRWDDAIACFREAIRLDPDYAMAHNNLGAVLAVKRQYREAIASYQQALSLDARDVKFHINLGLALLATGDVEGAIGCYRKAISVDSGFSQAHGNLAQALHTQGKLPEAIASYRKAIDLDPKNALAHTNLGLALQSVGRLKEAIAIHRKAVVLDPQNPHAHAALGAALYANRQLEEAIACYRKACALDSRNPTLLNNLASCLKDTGRLDQAIGVYRQAVSLAPRSAMAHYNLGVCLNDSGQPEEAIVCYHKVLSLDPNYAEAWCNLGHILRRKGRFAEALRYLLRGHELGSPRPGWHYPSREWVLQCQRLLLLESRLPDLLAGKLQPVSEAERLEYARCCALTDRQAGAARLYAAGFEADPRLAANLEAGHRYSAACAAALAGCGKGQDAGPIDQEGRTRLRQQALNWLRADLTLWRKQLASWWPGKPAEAREALVYWRKDPNLAGVREPTHLAWLPEAERKEWEKLWAEIASMLKPVERKEAPDR
jgi:serine/threonine-protein kinase